MPVNENPNIEENLGTIDKLVVQLLVQSNVETYCCCYDNFFLVVYLHLSENMYTNLEFRIL